ncbi:restriction endonuclease subunit S [Romboutsia sp. 1001216sp1]|uniref:restriction endonuclease subunit S n=1 Tax=unclassified Romboutsia TaxID=2626894 RepID=UPI00189DFF5F|nr:MULTISPECIES: restriction endonuclease subunit S [unclassified Romboutsia]MDB8803225.1 restriction endonuclease subunit S [Romboutsia sp. 1001216sp1]MDB8814584.1 restriction endonuclease subunit S [Romboutsia sp. 1001216sp1]
MNKTPKLRFKEFSEGLEHHKFKDLVLLQRGSSPRPINQYVTNSDDGVNWIKIGDVSKDSTVIYETKEKITPEGAKKSRFVDVGDLILSNSMSFGRPYIMAIEGYIHDGWFVLKNYNKNFNRDYLCQLLTSPAIQKQYKRLAAGGVVDNISSELVNSVEINLPSKEEQEKIASFFSLIDDKISLQGEKVEALKDYKKGMMQKIFSRELRFKDDDGRDYPEWEEKKLGECIDIITDYVAAGSFATIRENVQYKNDKDYAQLIRTVDLKSKFKNSNNFVYVDKNAFEFLYRVNLNKESIILPNVGNIGEVYFVKPENLPNENNVLAPNSILLRSSKNSNLFLYQLFSTKGFRDSLDIITSKSGQPKFNKTELKEIRLNMPTEQEQIKIAKFLNNIDFKIAKEQEKLDSLNEYKKGLLQQIFV